MIKSATKLLYREKPEKWKHEQAYEFWKMLKGIKNVEFMATTLPKKVSHGKGNGIVSTAIEKNTITFQEKGTVTATEVFNFKNVFRWTYHQYDAVISLEHLRHGTNNPVFLFQLVPKGMHLFESVHAHLCGKDTYFGIVRLYPNYFTLLWRIIGPKKNEEILYTYS